MRTPRLSRRSLAGAALAVVLVLSTSACGGDDKKSDTSSEASTNQSEFCKLAKELGDAPPAERAEKLTAAAPDAIKPEMEALKKLVDLQDDPTADEIQKAEAASAAGTALPKVAVYLKDECGVTIDFSM